MAAIDYKQDDILIRLKRIEKRLDAMEKRLDAIDEAIKNIAKKELIQTCGNCLFGVKLSENLTGCRYLNTITSEVAYCHFWQKRITKGEQ
jgi:hypothetical protein